MGIVCSRRGNVLQVSCLLLRVNIENKQIEEERLQAEEEEREEERLRAEERRAARKRKSSTFWDALGNFTNILSSVSRSVSAYQPYSSFSMDTDYSSSSSVGSNHDYQSEYNRWKIWLRGTTILFSPYTFIYIWHPDFLRPVDALASSESASPLAKGIQMWLSMAYDKRTTVS